MLPETRDELAALTAAFVRDLPAMVQGLVLAIDRLRASPADVALCGMARRRAHQIAERALLRMDSSCDFGPEIDAGLRVLDPMLWRARRLDGFV